MSKARAEEYQEAPIHKERAADQQIAPSVAELREPVVMDGWTIPAGTRLVLCGDAGEGMTECWFNGRRVKVDASEVIG